MGVVLNYEVTGDRRSPAVLFLHGFMGSSADWRGELEGLAVPALAIAGALDEKYAGVSSRMAGIDPRLETAVVPGAGHTVHVETPAEYNSLLWRFVDGLSFALGETEPVP
jgi:pimeloyl-ACP methyl ester carboxylesterase